MTVIECVANLSEGRRPERLTAWANVLRSTPGLALLDFSGDVSHNRSVFTFAGEPAAVRLGALTLAALAIEHIDVSHQSGAHPRLGAIDVIPFVPLRAAAMETCVTLAREVGRTLADTFALPVYLYEDASLRPNRRRLEEIRRGGFEGLREKLQSPNWEPDFGPARPHPTAGAAIVGARPILIAYNVNLATDRVDIARHIASRVRERGGGLAAVKALGLWLPERGIAQVSMNLVDYRQTPPQVAYDAVRRLAREEGVDVLNAELIGLIPAAAMSGTTPAAMGLPEFSDLKLLEAQLTRFGL